MSNESLWYSVHEAAILRAGFGLAPGPIQCTKLALHAPYTCHDGDAWATAPRRRRGSKPVLTPPPPPDDLTILWIHASPVFIYTSPCVHRFQALLSHIDGWQDQIPYRWNADGLDFGTEYLTTAQQLANEFVDLLHTTAASSTHHVILDELLAKYAEASVPLSAPWFVGWLLGYPIALCSADLAMRAQLSTMECTKVQVCIGTSAPLRELIFPAGVVPAGVAADTLTAITAGCTDVLSTADPLSRKWYALLHPICAQLGAQDTAELRVIESTCMAGSAI